MNDKFNILSDLSILIDKLNETGHVTLAKSAHNVFMRIAIDPRDFDETGNEGNYELSKLNETSNNNQYAPQGQSNILEPADEIIKIARHLEAYLENVSHSHSSMLADSVNELEQLIRTNNKYYNNGNNQIPQFDRFVKMNVRNIMQVLDVIKRSVPSAFTEINMTVNKINILVNRI